MLNDLNFFTLHTLHPLVWWLGSALRNPNIPCSKPPWQSISKTKLQFCQLAKPYKIHDYSGPSGLL